MGLFADRLEGIQTAGMIHDIDKIRSGHPGGVRGEDLLPESKILAVADAVEAISTHRPYRPALGIEAALEEIVGKRGLLFDPDAVDACVRLFRQKGYTLPD